MISRCLAGFHWLIIIWPTVSILSSDSNNRSDELIDVFLSDIDVACDNYALLCALLNVDAHGIKDVGKIVASESPNLDHSLSGIRFVAFELGYSHWGDMRDAVSQFLVQVDCAVNNHAPVLLESAHTTLNVCKK